ncbi:hypothetical protein Q3G72_030182 [Acer saccharum]|nr:hypothetical protein Q3G72_030182 [Acer saccharum]
MYVTPLNCVCLLMISIFIYGGSKVAQVNEASSIDTSQVNQESMPKTTVPDAASLACYHDYGTSIPMSIWWLASSTEAFHSSLYYSRLDLYYKYFTMYVTPLNCVCLMMISIFIYGGSKVAQVNEASSIDTSQVNQESMPETTVPDAASLAC